MSWKHCTVVFDVHFLVGRFAQIYHHIFECDACLRTKSGRGYKDWDPIINRTVGGPSILFYFSGLIDKPIFSSWQSSNKWPNTRNNSFANHGWNRCPCPIQPKAVEIFMWFKHMFLDNSQPRAEPSSFSQCGYALTYLSRWSHLVWNTFEYNSNH